MAETAYVLARARAEGRLPASLGFVDGVERAADGVGRRLVLLRGAPPSSAYALGWHEAAEPDPDTLGFAVQRFAPSALATLLACVACCWPGPGSEPFPGVASTVSDVLAVAARLHVDRNWATGALHHDLPAAGFVVVNPALPDDEVRLGPAFAAWPSGQVSLLRRVHGRLLPLVSVV